jgi:hypothetical protein
MKCECLLWKKNFEFIKGLFVFGSIHELIYKGDIFCYCPWCGEKLIEEENEI